MKHILKKICSFILVFLFLFNFHYTFADDLEDNNDTVYTKEDYKIDKSIETSTTDTSTLNLNARSCVVLDRLSKNILYGKNETNKVKMASTTKIMTAIVVLENSSLGQTVEVSKKAASIGGSRLGLKTGDKITINDLLYGLLLCSGNDAAICLAESVAGSVDEFSVLMNNKAQELGLYNTHFESPHGLDSTEHYTTAYELALLSDYALQNTTFKQIVGTKTATIYINGSPKNLTNTNELLGNLNGVYGVKTGFTNGANRCLVTSCKRGEMDIICVVLGCDTKKFRTQDSIKLIEWSFENYEYVNIENILNEKLIQWKEEHSGSIFVEKGKSELVNFSFSELESPIIPIKKSLIDNIDVNIFIDTNLSAPVFENDKIGYTTISSEEDFILNCDIIANETIEKKDVSYYLYDFFKCYPNIVNEQFNNLL